VHKTSVASAILLVVLTSACSAADSTPSSPSSTASSTSSEQSGAPTAAAPSATPRTKAEDAADLKRALVTPADLGEPWIAPKKVNRAGGKKGEICPGHVSATGKLTFTASASTDLTEGKGTGRNIASYRIKTLSDEGVGALAAALKIDQKACARYQDPSGFKVVRTAEGPTSVDGAEVISAWTERVYYVRPRNKLAFARHFVVAHQGRVVTSTSYAFLADKKDPNAEDFSKETRLLQVQLKKNASVFT